MKAKYCLPIIKKTKEEVVKMLSIKGYDYYEIWLDYIKDLDEKFLSNILKKVNKKLIFVYRRKGLEKNKLSLEKRLEIILYLSKLNTSLDIDFLTQHEELEFFRKHRTRANLILSFHDYKETPKLDYLQNMLNKMKRYNADIYKVSVLCQKEEDAFVLLNLLLRLRREKLKYIILGMGKNGLITRIFGALWGNEINFAPIHIKDRSAEGQLTKDKLELILKELN